MHKIQEQARNADTANDEQLLAFCVGAWSVVCEENAAQLSLIPEAQQKQWLEFLDEQTTALKQAVSYYYAHETLNDEHRRAVKNLIDRIAKAKHVHEVDLKPEPAEGLGERQARMERQERSRGWLSKLQGENFHS